MTQIKVRIGPGGRLVIPSVFRKQLGISPGDQVVVLSDSGGLRILTLQQSIERARKLVAKYAGERRLSEELIAEESSKGSNHG